VEPICLPNYGEEFTEGTMCWISGWGATEEDGESQRECIFWLFILWISNKWKVMECHPDTGGGTKKPVAHKERLATILHIKN